MKLNFIKNLFIWNFIALIMFGCSTTEVNQFEATEAQINRVFKYQNQQANTGKIIISRDEGFTSGGTCLYAVWINGELVSKLDTKEFATFHLTQGEYIIKVSREPNAIMGWWCGMESGDYSQVETTIKENETKYFRLSIQINGKAIIQRSK